MPETHDTLPPRKTAATARTVAVVALTGLLRALAALADPPTPGLDSILASLAGRPHGHVLYSEEIVSPLFKRAQHTSGELLFDAPDRLEKKTLRPAPADLVVEGDTVTMTRGTHRSSIRLLDYPQLSPLLNAIRATLAGDRAALERSFQVSVITSEPNWELSLEPLPGGGNPLYRSIRIRGSNGQVESVAFERTNGERTTMTLEPLDR